MMLSDELAGIVERLDQMIMYGRGPSIQEPIACLEKAASEVAKAWSGSSLGYHSTIYYEGLKIPPSGAYFDAEWGFMNESPNRTHGNWKKFDPDEIQAAVYSRAGNPDMEMLRNFYKNAIDEFNDCKMKMLSILQVALPQQGDDFLAELKDNIDKLFAISKVEIAEQLLPSSRVYSRDSIAANQGFKLPPHLDVVSEVLSFKNTLGIMGDLMQISTQVGAHISRREAHRRENRLVGEKVFIGHGRSLVWRELKDFITDHLGLPVDEFNRVPVAGSTIVERLNQMLDTASIAFLIMTGEDELPDGKLQARMNVVHEVGLFQGRLGFSRAIVLLEDGCEEFSNISGHVQIRFAKGNIRGVFQDIREVLEREELLPVNS